MLKPASRYLLPVGSAAAIVYGATAWQRSRNKDSSDSNSFSIPIKSRSADGRSVLTKDHFITRLSQSEIEQKLTRNSTSYSIPRAGGGGRWRYETASVSSNDPIEDAHAEMIIRPGEPGSKSLLSSPALPKGQTATPLEGDTLFFAIMDGHSGYQTSRLLAKTLIPAVALELSTLSSGATKPPQGWLSYLSSFIPFTSSSRNPPGLTSYPFASDPKYVQTAIQTAFANLDSQIINAPIRHVDALTQPFDKTSDAYQLAVVNLLPALSGSCALLAVLDQAREDVYVAVTGDSRAVAGYRTPAIQGSKWEADELSEDQTGRNPNEHKRIQSEHPADEAEAVVQRGRIFGGLEPTRAFGDARYKWPKAFQNRLVELFNNADSGLPSRVRSPPSDLKTPPYVTSRPEITHRKVSFCPTASSSSASGSPPLQFIVLATDGLWDRLSSTTAVEVVGGYLDRNVPSTTSTPPRSVDDGWTYTDTNVATHLIRNALRGNSHKEPKAADAFAKLMSIPAPYSRRYRDDITVTVVWWEEDQDPKVAHDITTKTENLSKAKL